MNNCGVLQFFGCKNVQIARRIEFVTGTSAMQVQKLRTDQQLLLLDGDAIFSRKVDYLTDPAYQQHFDPNPFYRRSSPIDTDTAGPGRM